MQLLLDKTAGTSCCGENYADGNGHARRQWDSAKTRRGAPDGASGEVFPLMLEVLLLVVLELMES